MPDVALEAAHVEQHCELPYLVHQNRRWVWGVGCGVWGVGCGVCCVLCVVCCVLRVVLCCVVLCCAVLCCAVQAM